MLRLILASLLVLSLVTPTSAQETAPAASPGAADIAADDDDDLFDDDYDPDGYEDDSEEAQLDREAEPEAEKSLGIEEIMVTSQRRRSTLQDVPVSVTAFSASEIEAQGIQDIKGISNYTPNLEIKTAFAASNPTLYIRGVGLNDYNANAASSVAVYQDEVYMNFPAGQLFQFFDVQSVEVLRGPQGSLWGRNASAGAIRVTSKEPTEDFDMSATVSYGNYNEAEVEAAVSGPLIDGLVSGRLALHWRQRDGTMKNLCAFDVPTSPGDCGVPNPTVTQHIVPAGLPRELNDVNNWAGRGILKITPELAAPNLEMEWLINLHGGRNLSQGVTFFNSRGKTRQDGSFVGDPSFPKLGFPIEDAFVAAVNHVGFEYLDTFGGSAKGTMHFGDDLTLTSLTAYDHADRDVEDDFDGTARTLSHNIYTDVSWQLVQDMKLDWQATDELFFNFGAFFLTGDLKIDNFFGQSGRRTSGIDIPVRGFIQDISQDNNTFAFYGHFSWSFLDDFTVDGGIRYNWERKTFDAHSTFRPQPQLCVQNDTAPECLDGDGNGTPAHLLPKPTRGGVSVVLSQTWSAPTGDLSLSYRLTEDTNIYGKYSRGWKPGGFNGSVTGNAGVCDPKVCRVVEAIEAETVDGWELGLKSYWFDRRLMVNAAVFFQKYEDLQVFVVENSNLTGVPLPKLINANNAQIYGLEMDIVARPIVGLNINAAFGWLESRYLDFTRNYFRTGRPPRSGRGAPPVIREVQADFTGNRLQNNPRFSFSGTASYEIPLGETHGYLRPGFSWTFSSLSFFDPTEGASREGTARFREQISGNTFLGQPAYWLLDARLAYTTADERVEITAWVRNLADTVYSVEAFETLATYQSVQRAIGEPRTFGLTLWFSY